MGPPASQRASSGKSAHGTDRFRPFLPGSARVPKPEGTTVIIPLMLTGQRPSCKSFQSRSVRKTSSGLDFKVDSVGGSTPTRAAASMRGGGGCPGPHALVGPVLQGDVGLGIMGAGSRVTGATWDRRGLGLEGRSRSNSMGSSMLWESPELQGPD